MDHDGGMSHLALNNVQLYAPAPVNLLSWGALRKQGWKLDLIAKPNVLIRGRIKVPLLRCGPAGRLLAVCLPLSRQTPVSQPSPMLVAKEADTFEGWHKRLGHMSTLLDLGRQGRLIITNVSSNTFKMEDCDVCARAKTTRLTSGDMCVRATKPLEIVHSDIADPLKPSYR